MPVWVDMYRVSVLVLLSAHGLPPLPLHAFSVSISSSMQAFPALAQVQTLRRVNECLLAENRAMLRVLARLSETASMPETEDLWSSDIIRPLFLPCSSPLLLLRHITSTLLCPPGASSAPSSSAVFLSGRSCTLPLAHYPPQCISCCTLAPALLYDNLVNSSYASF